jgi:CO/xanthine dehydrogenase Mo-binding subunit
MPKRKAHLRAAGLVAKPPRKSCRSAQPASWAVESKIDELAHAAGRDPALGSAIFSACGARIRSLPITAEAVKANMRA